MILHTLGVNFPFIFRYCANISRIFDKSQLLDVRFHPRPTLLFTTICTIPKYVSCFLISFLLTFNLFFSCLVYFVIELLWFYGLSHINEPVYVNITGWRNFFERYWKVALQKCCARSATFVFVLKTFRFVQIVKTMQKFHVPCASSNLNHQHRFKPPQNTGTPATGFRRFFQHSDMLETSEE